MKCLDHAEHIPVALQIEFHPVHDPFHQVHTKSAAAVVFEVILHIRCLDRAGIEMFPPVRNDDLKVLSVADDLDIDLFVRGIVVTVLDDIRACLIDRDGDLVDIILAESVHPRLTGNEFPDIVQTFCLARYTECGSIWF